MAQKYYDFDLQIEPAGEKYRIRLLNAPTGQATGEFVLPFTDAEVSNFLSRIGQVRRSMRRVDAPELGAAKEFGGRLFSAIFSGEMVAQLRGSLDQAISNDRGLRIRLRLTDVPALADLPWEFLYDTHLNQFLTTSSETPLVRFLDLPQRIVPLRVALPLRVLVVIAGPRNLKRLDAQGEWERLQEALGELIRGGQIVLEQLPAATLDALRLRARGTPFHILHFIGHGGFDVAAQDGVLQFEDENGMSHPVRGELLGMQLHDHRSLRLAVLNACEGARSSRQDSFSGVAQSLVQQRVPAVIAMQFEISDAAAKVFAQEFYRAVAEGNPVDFALSESRKALFNEEFGQEWATPVLYMRSQEGVLFELEPAAAPVLDTQLANRERTKAERATRAEKDRAAREAADAARQAAEKKESERLAQEKAEADRLAAAASAEQAERAQKERVAREAAEAQRQAAEKKEREQLAREKAEMERLAAVVTRRKGLPTPLLPEENPRRNWRWVFLPAALLFLSLAIWYFRGDFSKSDESHPPQTNHTSGGAVAPQDKIGGAETRQTEENPVKAPPLVGGTVPSPANNAKTGEAEVAKRNLFTELIPGKPPVAAPVAMRIIEPANVERAKLVERVEPVYPPQARQARVTGTVQLHAIIAKDGTVRNLGVKSGPPLLTQAALDAVKHWRYWPTFQNGNLVEVETTIEVPFSLPDSGNPVTAVTAPPAAPTPAADATAKPPATTDHPAPVIAAAAPTVPCTLGKVEFNEQGSRLIVSAQYSYRGSSALDTIAISGIALNKNNQRVAGLTLTESTLRAASGTGLFSIESHPSLNRKGEQGEFVLVTVLVKATNVILCSETVPYRREW
jgi:TonB family protein